MKANQLRIGNYRNTWVSGRLSILRFELQDFCKDEIESDEPVTLTKEWLLNFGFKQNDNNTFSDCFYSIGIGSSKLHINPDNGIVWIYTPSGNPFNNPQLIKYVHQLQNLYFALTGEELTFSSTPQSKKER